jgi:hypothetical protein
MREHCRESSRNFPGRNAGTGRAAKRRAGPALVVVRTGRAGPARRPPARPGPKNFDPFSALVPFIEVSKALTFRINCNCFN